MTKKVFEGLHAPTIIALCAILPSIFLLNNVSLASVKASLASVKENQARLEVKIDNLYDLVLNGKDKK